MRSLKPKNSMDVEKTLATLKAELEQIEEAVLKASNDSLVVLEGVLCQRRSAVEGNQTIQMTHHPLLLCVSHVLNSLSAVRLGLSLEESGQRDNVGIGILRWIGIRRLTFPKLRRNWKNLRFV
jgi:hypothetical protein